MSALYKEVMYDNCSEGSDDVVSRTSIESDRPEQSRAHSPDLHIRMLLWHYPLRVYCALTMVHFWQ